MELQKLLDAAKPKTQSFKIDELPEEVTLKQLSAGAFIDIFKLQDKPSEMQIAVVAQCLAVTPAITPEQVKEMRQDIVTAIASKALAYNGLDAAEGETEKN